MKRRVKEFGKDAMILAGTGIGLSVASGLGGGAAVGKLTAGIGPIASLTVAKHGLGILSDVNKDLKKKMRM